MERPYVLHLFSPGRQVSPFDVNMAADAGYQIIVPYVGVELAAIAGLTQDTIFSRGPKGAARSGIFIGGRDALLAADMLAQARAAMFPPFQVGAMADPSGAYTTAAALVACVEAALKHHHGLPLAGRRLLVLGGTGPVGRIAGVIAAQAGAEVGLSSRHGQDAAEEAAQATARRFGVALRGVSGADRAALRASLAEAELLLCCTAAGVQAVSADDLGAARSLLVAADVNAVPPSGIAGIDNLDQGRPLAGACTGAVGIGALAVGQIKYQTQHRLLLQMRGAGNAPSLGFAEAYATARTVLAEASAGS